MAAELNPLTKRMAGTTRKSRCQVITCYFTALILVYESQVQNRGYTCALFVYSSEPTTVHALNTGVV